MAKVLISRLTDPFLTKAVRSRPDNQSPTVQLQSYRNVAGIRNLDILVKLFLENFKDWRCKRVLGRRLVPFRPF
jgi:hypothetical protein